MGHRAFGIHAIQRSGEGGERGLNMNDFKKPHKYRFQTQIPIPGAPNDGFLLRTLETLFRLSRVLFDL